MKIGIGTTFNFDIPFEKMIPMIRQAGFSIISLAGGNFEQSRYLKINGRERIKRICVENGVVVDSVHAPLANDIDISNPDSELRQFSVDLIIQTVDACTAIGCTTLILHLSNRFPDGELDDRIISAQKSLDRIIPYAEQRKICLAIENLINPNTLMLFDHILKQYQNDNVGVCYDTSHANRVGNLYSLLNKYSERIIAVHISDNKGQLDDHMLPFEGNIDWERFAQHFASIDYKGVFLLEVEMRESSFKEPEIFLKEACIRTTKLITLIEKYKK